MRPLGTIWMNVARCMVVTVLALVTSSCNKDVESGTLAPVDGGPAVVDATSPRGDAGRAPCLDRPTDLPRPPSGQLPCDLLPPGFSR
ncbi:MAG TPA: hypothetical protein VJT73_11025 [Polyangiaceae bacterium]|nr:hypothetical protein [Polyangiaceae bacterium]